MKNVKTSNIKAIIPMAMLAVFTGCATVKLATPTQSDVDRVSAKYPGYSLANLNNGQMLFEQHCANCHHLKDPTKRSEEQWQKIVPKMVNKINKKEGNVLDSSGQEAILKYLVTMSGSNTSK